MLPYPECCGASPSPAFLLVKNSLSALTRESEGWVQAEGASGAGRKETVRSCHLSDRLKKVPVVTVMLLAGYVGKKPGRASVCLQDLCRATSCFASIPWPGVLFSVFEASHFVFPFFLCCDFSDMA